MRGVALEARGVSHRYGAVEILRNLSFAISAGEVAAFIGPTGTGKSTLLRLLDLLETPTEGDVFIFEEKAPAGAMKRLSLRRRMAFVHQKPLVFSGSVFDNVALPLKWRSIKGQASRNRVFEALALVGMADYAGREARTLSGGETQRIALARALAAQPEVIFLDEPTANLDPNSRAAVEQLIGRIIRESSLTVVMTTHDLAQGQRLARRLGVLIKGELLQLGTAEEVFVTPACRAVAEFIGVENILSGIVRAVDDGLVSVSVGEHEIMTAGDFSAGDRLNLFIRPEDITIAAGAAVSSARNHLDARIVQLSLVGPLVRLQLDCGFPLLAVVTRQSAEELGLSIGRSVHAQFKTAAIHAVRTEAENRPA